ncbi:MAG TPA: DNA-3-methyladenine glycosylase I [Candidatus Baltobacteraceae bacterium]|jgi:3-methyladenine DNA glycosylase Tag
MSAPTIPETLVPARLGEYLEVMTRAVFQAGLSWRGIALHWDAYRREFADFDAQAVAAFADDDVDRLMHAEGVLHSSRKIRATIENAKAMLELDRRPDGFAGYLRGFRSYDVLVADLRKHFKFMGEMNCWYFLFRVREPVPRFETWVKTIPGDHPRMKEMVELARASSSSSETR